MKSLIYNFEIDLTIKLFTDAEKILICCFIIKTKIESKIEIEQYVTTNQDDFFPQIVQTYLFQQRSGTSKSNI